MIGDDDEHDDDPYLGDEDEENFDPTHRDAEKTQDDMGREIHYVSVFAKAVPDAEKPSFQAINDKANHLVEVVREKTLSDVDVAFELDNGFFNNKERSFETGLRAVMDTASKLAPDAFSSDGLLEHATAYLRAKYLQYAGDRYIDALALGDQSGAGRAQFAETIEKALGTSKAVTEHFVRTFETEAAKYELGRSGQGR